MDAISKWVTQIIIFLLLAAIIELLIPINSMKKYIKLVLGLILMLIFLKPVFFLFSFDFQSELTTTFEGIYQADQNIKQIENLTKEQKIDIQASQAAYILDEMALQLNNVANEPLQKSYHVEIMDIEFLFLNENEVTFDNLDEIIVYMQESVSKGGGIRLVDEVIIQQDQTEHIDKERQEEKEKDVVQFLKEVWELQDKKITIKWEGGTF